MLTSNDLSKDVKTVKRLGGNLEAHPWLMATTCQGTRGFLNYSFGLACWFGTLWHRYVCREYPWAPPAIQTCWPFPWKWLPRTPGERCENPECIGANRGFEQPAMSTFSSLIWNTSHVFSWFTMLALYDVSLFRPLPEEILVLERQQAVQIESQASFLQRDWNSFRSCHIQYCIYFKCSCNQQFYIIYCNHLSILFQPSKISQDWRYVTHLAFLIWG